MISTDPALGRWEAFAAVLEAMRAGRHIALDGLGGSAQAYLVSAVAREMQRGALVVVPTGERADALHDDLAAFLADRGVSPEAAGLFVFPSLETLLYEEARPDRELVRERLATLQRLLSGQPAVVIATPESMLHVTLPPVALRAAQTSLTAGSQIEQVALLGRLVELGYERQAAVEGPGEFAVRGGIVDVFPATYLEPVRVEFFGDEVESLRLFDPSTQRSRGPVSEVHLTPAREVLLGEVARRAAGAVNAALARQVALLTDMGRGDAADRLQAKVAYAASQLEQGAHFDHAEYYLPYLFPPATLLDYVPAGMPVFVDSPRDAGEHFRSFLAEVEPIYRARLQSGSLLPLPHDLYARLEVLGAWLAARGAAYLSLLPQADPDLTPRGVPQVSVEMAGVEPFVGGMDRLVHALRGWQQQHQEVVIASYQDDRLMEILAEAGLTGIAASGRLQPQEGRVVVSHHRLSAGFRLPAARLVVLSDTEIFGASRLRHSLRRRHTQGVPITSVSQLSPGDYVVHINHGIGLYEGLERRVVDGAEREFMRISYAGEDKLFVPVDQLDRVQKYIGGEDAAPTIHRLGGADWDRTKRRARKQAQEVARELVRLYAARQSQPGFAFSPDTPWQQEMESAFPYQETPDQLVAIQETKQDMEQPRPMDRLICGDVGFGKTEVAIRAAFKAVMDGKQVAVLVPTTILAEQHLTTFQERMSAYPIRIEMLSRFRSPADRAAVVQGLRAGTVDVVIGTHRLLSKDVQFRSLGLLIIDEEQRFGVRHKERLKQLRATVDTLTMTATPIPRTLHMALSGIREMSVINNPPEGRMPIRTRAIPRDDDLLREALLREIERGGQVYFVHNRIESIGHVAEHVRRLVPHARIAVAHGQLPEEQLERIMLDFYAGRFDILVSTAIIESGLDVPNVNTIIIDEADKLGLAQLYQLRGRVGRSDRQAYAYLTWTPHKRLTEQAQKRIAAIREFSELGSGFKVALRDLEIRGAGNLLGAEQSGFIASVGFEMYTQMLAEAVGQLKGEQVPPETTTTIDLPVDAYIPEEYVPGLNQRIEIYKRMAAIRTEPALRDMESELNDRFGSPLPPPVQNLLRLVHIKLECMRSNILAISTERLAVVIRLLPTHHLPLAVMRNLQRQLSSVGETAFRLAAPVAAQDRISLTYNNLTSPQLLDVVERLVVHLGKITNREYHPA